MWEHKEGQRAVVHVRVYWGKAGHRSHLPRTGRAGRYGGVHHLKFPGFNLAGLSLQPHYCCTTLATEPHAASKWVRACYGYLSRM